MDILSRTSLLSFLLVLGCTQATDDEPGSREDSGGVDSEPDVGTSSNSPVVGGGQTGDEGSASDTPCLRSDQIVFAGRIVEVNADCSQLEILEPLSTAAEASTWSPGDVLVGPLLPFFTTPSVYNNMKAGDPLLVMFSASPVGDTDGLLFVTPDNSTGSYDIRWRGATYPFTLDELMADSCLAETHALPYLDPGDDSQDDGQFPDIAIFGECEALR